MFDFLTGLSTNNSLVGTLTRPGGLSTFNVGNLFGPPLGANDNVLFGGGGTFNVGNLFGPPLGANDNFLARQAATFGPNLTFNSSSNVLPGFTDPFSGVTFPPIDLGNTGSFLGTGNFAADQTLSLISGIRNGGGSMGLNSLANRGTVLAGGLQALPQPSNGRPIFL